MMNPFDIIEEKQPVKIQLISTWFKPILITIIIIISTIMLVPQLENDDEFLSLLSCAAPILALASIVLLDFIPINNLIIHDISKNVGLIFVFFIFYLHLWDRTRWTHFNNFFFIFCQSLGVITTSGFIDTLYKKNKHTSKKIINCCQIVLISIFLILPNTYNTNLEKSVWETILRIFLFIFTCWVQLFALVVFEDKIDKFEYFNTIWWILIVQRYMIPIVGFVWMNTILRVTRQFSNQKIITPSKNEVNTPLLDETKEETKNSLKENNPVKTSPPPKKIPTSMFSPPTTTPTGEPRQRMLRRAWKTRPVLNPKLSHKEQLAKLQALSSSESPV